MLKVSSILFCLFLFSSLCFSQAAVAPVKWQKYSAPEHNFTALFPKLPTLTVSRCDKEDSWTYAGYADGVVYVLSVNDKSTESRKCSDPARDGYENRLKYLKKSVKETLKESPVTLGNFTGVKLEGKNRVHLFYRHPEKKRQWYELWVVGADENKPEVKNFLSSLVIDKQPLGTNIGSGSLSVIGDQVKSDCFIPKPAPKSEKEKKAEAEAKKKSGEDQPEEDEDDSKFKLVLRPFPSYTEGARQNSVAGIVSFDVTFSAAGNITDILVLRGLPYGLTGRAVEAALKMAFVPAKKDGKFCTSVKEVQYIFNLY